MISTREGAGGAFLDARAADGADGKLAEQPDAAEALTSARDELASIARAYDRALRRGLTERSRQTIDDAFDEADRLGRRMLAASRRLRLLERAPADSERCVASGPESSR